MTINSAVNLVFFQHPQFLSPTTARGVMAPLQFHSHSRYFGTFPFGIVVFLPFLTLTPLFFFEIRTPYIGLFHFLFAFRGNFNPSPPFYTPREVHPSANIFGQSDLPFRLGRTRFRSGYLWIRFALLYPPVTECIPLRSFATPHDVDPDHNRPPRHTQYSPFSYEFS